MRALSTASCFVRCFTSYAHPNDRRLLAVYCAHNLLFARFSCVMGDFLCNSCVLAKRSRNVHVLGVRYVLAHVLAAPPKTRLPKRANNGPWAEQCRCASGATHRRVGGRCMHASCMYTLPYIHVDDRSNGRSVGRCAVKASHNLLSESTKTCGRPAVTRRAP